MVAVPTLTDGVVTLRAHGEDDIEGSLEQCRDPLSQRWTTVPVPYSRDDAARFIRHAMPGGWESDQEWSFAMSAVDPATGEARYAGTVSLRNEHAGRAEIAYGSHPWARGTGVVERALRLLLDWGFAERDLHTVIWWADEGNWASRKLAWRLGFSFDGTVRQWLPKRGELNNAWVGSLLRDDERAPRNPWYDVPRIVGDGVVLRVHRDDDAVRVQEACSDARTAYWLRGLPDPYTLVDAERFVRLRSNGMALGTEVHWVVADPETDLLLANISLFRQDPDQGVEIGYWTHPEARGRGVMTEACRLVCRHAFVPPEDGGLGRHRVQIFHAAGNTASRHVIEANGFTHIGTERSSTLLRDGTYVDTEAYDLLAEEWTAAQRAEDVS